MPIVQHVALCNNHVHSPQMGPYIMPAMDALEGTGAMIGSYHLSDGTEASDDPDVMGSTEEALLRAIQVRKPSLAEQYYLWLEQNRTRGETLDLLLPASVSRNSIDDHYFVYPMFTFKALDVIGWEWAPVLMRVVVRYQARNPFSLTRTQESVFEDVTRLIEDYALMDREIPVQTGDRETRAIGELGEAIGGCTDYLDGMEADGEGPGGRTVAGRGRGGVVGGGVEGVPEVELRQPDGLTPAHGYERASVPGEHGRGEPEAQDRGIDHRADGAGVPERGSDAVGEAIRSCEGGVAAGDGAGRSCWTL